MCSFKVGVTLLQEYRAVQISALRCYRNTFYSNVGVTLLQEHVLLKCQRYVVTETRPTQMSALRFYRNTSYSNVGVTLLHEHVQL